MYIYVVVEVLLVIVVVVVVVVLVLIVVVVCLLVCFLAVAQASHMLVLSVGSKPREPCFMLRSSVGVYHYPVILTGS